MINLYRHTNIHLIIIITFIATEITAYVPAENETSKLDFEEKLTLLKRGIITNRYETSTDNKRESYFKQDVAVKYCRVFIN